MDGHGGEISPADAETAQEALQSTPLVLGSIVLSAIVGLLWLIAHVPGIAATGSAACTVLVVVVSFVAAPTWLRKAGEIPFILADALRSTEWAKQKRKRWKEWIEARPTWERASRYSELEVGSLWIPFVIQLMGIAWIIHFSGGFSASPFASVPGVIFVVAATITTLPSERTPPRYDVRFRSHPYTRLSALVIVFCGGVVAWDVCWSYHVDPEIPAKAVTAMTITALAIGVILVMLARLEEETETNREREGAEGEEPSAPTGDG